MDTIKSSTRSIIKIKTSLQAISSYRHLAKVLALIGVGVYLLIAFSMMGRLQSFLDEGLYLYKGYLFASGAYSPYQDYGVWTNHMPLAFLIPGIIQYIFGPGLLTGRLLSIVMSMVALAGLWVITRRLGNDWWAALAIWSMALNPAEIKLFTMALPQSTCASLFLWSLVCILGRKRPNWQIALGVVLAVLLLFVRENMLPVLLIMIFYAFWQHGKKAGFIALLAGSLAMLLGHAVFWPGILRIWSNWLPESLTPFLSTFRLPAGIPYDETSLQQIDFHNILLLFWVTIRLHPVPFIAVFATWLLWPRREKWALANYRIAIILSLLFLLLWIEHMYVAFHGVTCVDCILLYVGYFDFLGIILLANAYPYLERHGRFPRVAWITIFILLVSVCIAYSSYEDTGYPLTNIIIPEFISKHILPGPVSIRRLLGYYHGFTALQQRVLLPSLVGLVAGLGILLAGLLTRAGFCRSKRHPPLSYGNLILAILFLITLVLSPTIILGNGNAFYNCGEGTLQSYADAGAQIRSVIGSDSMIYWQGRSDAIFLYLPGVRIYPAQLNHTHSLFIDGDRDEMLKFGLWNLDLAEEWMQQADYLLVEHSENLDGAIGTLNFDGFDEIATIGPLGVCEQASWITIYQKP